MVKIAGLVNSLRIARTSSLDGPLYGLGLWFVGGNWICFSVNVTLIGVL
jgi:hypothetical protein